MSDTPQIGDKVVIKAGWGFNVYDPIGFHRSDGTVTGTITARHKNAGTLYFRLPSGQIASGAISGMEKTQG